MIALLKSLPKMPSWLLPGLIVFGLTTSPAQGQSFRFFVQQSGGLFEVKDNSGAGGRFIRSPSGEAFAGMPVVRRR